MAINSPLLEDVSINGATGILVNITGGPDLTLAEVNEACSLIQEAADEDANIIFGSVIDPNCGDEVRITVIATGFQARMAASGSRPRRQRARGATAGVVRSRCTRCRCRPRFRCSRTRGGYAHQHVAYAPIRPAMARRWRRPCRPRPGPRPIRRLRWVRPTWRRRPRPGRRRARDLSHAAVVRAQPADGSRVGGPERGRLRRRRLGLGRHRRAHHPPGGPLAAPGRQRRHRPAQPQRRPALPSDDLGIEESEYDTPAYLRRARADHDYGMGHRHAGEK